MNVTGGNGGDGGDSGVGGKAGSGGTGGEGSLYQAVPAFCVGDRTGGTGGNGGTVGCCLGVGGDGGAAGETQGIRTRSASGLHVDFDAGHNTLADLDAGSAGSQGTGSLGSPGARGVGGKFGWGGKSIGITIRGIGACLLIPWPGTWGQDSPIPNCSPCTSDQPGLAASVTGISANGGADVRVANSIVTSTSGTGVSTTGPPGGMSVAYSTIAGFDTPLGPGVVDGGGNSVLDPLFVDPNHPSVYSRDYRLSSNSPAIDAGNDAAVPADVADLDDDANTTEPTPVDLEGLPRFVDGDSDSTVTVDMGAYEFNGTLVDVPTTPDRPVAFALYASRPNPFTRSTTIRFDVPRPVAIDLVIYDVAGRQVRVLDRGAKAPGRHAATWDGRDQEGVRAKSGVYFYRFVASDFEGTRKLVYVR